MRQKKSMDAPDIPIAPMIDCVFLMLVYFMTTSSLQKSEADLPCPVGQAGNHADPLPAVDEQRLSLSSAGEVLWNGSRFDLHSGPSESRLLRSRLQAFRQTCESNGSEPSLRILPEPAASHQSLVRLLDAISQSGIETILLP